MEQFLWRRNSQYLTKGHRHLPSDLNSEDKCPTISKYIYKRLFIASQFVIAKYWKPQCPSIGHIAHTQNGVLCICEQE